MVSAIRKVLPAIGPRRGLSVLPSLFIVSCVFQQPARLSTPNEPGVAQAPEHIDVPGHVLQGYDATSRTLHLLGRDGATAAVAIPARFALRSIPDSALRSSYFYFVVNDALWGVPAESWPVDRERIREIRTIKIDLPTVAGRTLVAGFMFINTAP
jgi:hypothetical protein